MGLCAAPNCANKSTNGFRMFRFPRQEERKKRWLINCRRDQWIPGSSAYLCEVHFEESQYESNRQDGRKLLKSSAVPTIFDVPNPPKLFANKRIKGVGIPKKSLDANVEMEPVIATNVESEPDLISADEFNLLKKENELLKETLLACNAKYKALEKQHLALKESLFKCFSEEQMKNLPKCKYSVFEWSNDAIVKGLKLRFSLGKVGYEYLRSTGYPAPSYSTLNRRVQEIQTPFGVLDQIIDLLKTKVQTMQKFEKECVILFDEMEIRSVQDYETSSHSFVGNTTIGKSGIGKHYLVLMLRGLYLPWKQIVAHAITSSITGKDIKDFLEKTIVAVRSTGLNVRATVSDMASNNKAMWKEVGVKVNQITRNNTYQLNNDGIKLYSFADVPHLLKNLRTATLKHPIFIPENIRISEELPSRVILGGFIKDIWIREIDSDVSLRSMHHLSKEHLFPTQYNKMNVALAVQFFSVKTAAAIEKAVTLKEIDKNALTTAWWIRFINQWFELMTARVRKKTVTKRNYQTKAEFLKTAVDIFQNLVIDKGWKPLNTGLIMSTTSLIELSDDCFKEGCHFFLPGRLTQDAVENVFSQIRRKAGRKPTALEARRALRLICLSQYISDINNSNYANDSDRHLLNIAKHKVEKKEKTHKMFMIPSSSSAPFPTWSPQPPVSRLTVSEMNDVYYMAGAVMNGMMKLQLCSQCDSALKASVDPAAPNVPKEVQFLTDYANLGGLKNVSSGVLKICRLTEESIQINKSQILLKQIPMDGNLILPIVEQCSDISMPDCCNLKKKIVTFYLNIRGKSIANHMAIKMKKS